MSASNISVRKQMMIFVNPFQWWRDHQNTYPNLAQIAFDLFAIPAMSSECERSYCKASYTISARKSNLGNDIVEAGEVLRSWVSANVVVLSKRPHHRCCERCA